MSQDVNQDVVHWGHKSGPGVSGPGELNKLRNGRVGQQLSRLSPR